ncbi:hypothetical protein ACFWAT_11750 [Streptomyces syringium]|uniref:hypothetical protein n=1 Tax=Streptomyces syringium TaxID=76729 RepID=UPI0036639DE5
MRSASTAPITPQNGAVEGAPALGGLLSHRSIRIGTLISSETADRVTVGLLVLPAESEDGVTLQGGISRRPSAPLHYVAMPNGVG